MKGTGTAVDWWGMEQVLNGYDLHCQVREAVAYSVWQGGVPKFTFNDGDIGEGREWLEQHIKTLEMNGSTAMYTIRFHPHKPDQELTNKAEITGSANFKMHEPSYTAVTGRAQAPAPDARLDKILEVLINQEERLKAIENAELEEEIEEVEEEEPDQIGKVLNGIRQIEDTIKGSEVLSELYSDLRIGLRILAKKAGIELPQMNNRPRQEQAVNGNTMEGTTQQVDMRVVMSELVKQFPELPEMLVKLHRIMKEDPDMFDLAKKKLIKGVNQMSDND